MAKNKKKQEPITFSETYLELKELSAKEVEKELEPKEKGGKPGVLTSYGKRYYVFPRMDEIGLDTWQKIYDEILLYRDKKSNLSQADRKTLYDCYSNVVVMTKKANEFLNK